MYVKKQAAIVGVFQHYINHVSDLQTVNELNDVLVVEGLVESDFDLQVVLVGLGKFAGVDLVRELASGRRTFRRCDCGLWRLRRRRPRRGFWICRVFQRLLIDGALESLGFIDKKSWNNSFDNFKSRFLLKIF